MQIKFIAVVVRWFDRVNGNTYHSVSITRSKDWARIKAPMRYGYEAAYEQTARQLLKEAGWMKDEDEFRHIHWTIYSGTKKECRQNGE